MAAYDGPIVDIDIHHKPRTEAELIPYLPQRWRERFEDGWLPAALAVRSNNNQSLRNVGSRRADRDTEDGTLAGTQGTDYSLLRDALLDKYDYERVLLTHNLGPYGAHTNPELAVALCRATNDWNLDTWLTRDDRLSSVILAASASPLEAAAEVRRLAGNPRLAGVLLAGNPVGRPFGDPWFDPIYDAAVEVGLPVGLHVAADRPSYQVKSAGGRKATIVEELSQFPQQAMHYVSSFVTRGTFERFPSLRVVVLEYGIGWLPWLLYSLDNELELLREESSWVKRLPSEYVLEHLSFTMQPVEEGPDRRALVRLLELYPGIEDTLCFSSDYPHPSMDDPMFVARLMPKEWHTKFFYGNACRCFGWPLPQRAAPALA